MPQLKPYKKRPPLVKDPRFRRHSRWFNYAQHIVPISCTVLGLVIGLIGVYKTFSSDNLLGGTGVYDQKTFVVRRANSNVASRGLVKDTTVRDPNRRVVNLSDVKGRAAAAEKRRNDNADD